MQGGGPGGAVQRLHDAARCWRSQRGRSSYRSGIQNQSIAKPATVPASLLSNPAIQQSALGNVSKK